MPTVQLPAVTPKHKAWNKGQIIGQKRPFLPKQVLANLARRELSGNLRDVPQSRNKLNFGYLKFWLSLELTK